MKLMTNKTNDSEKVQFVSNTMYIASFKSLMIWDENRDDDEKK